jgi:hypothetical protein
MVNTWSITHDERIWSDKNSISTARIYNQ